MISYLFTKKPACIWQLDGVHFPPCILSLVIEYLRHTTPFMGERRIKGTSLRVDELHFLYVALSLHQRAPRLEIEENLSFISWLKLFRPDSIDMQTGRLSYRSAERTFIRKSSTPDAFLPVPHTMTSLTAVPCASDPNTPRIRPNPDIWGWMGEMSPLQIFTLLMKVISDPCWGGVKCPHWGARRGTAAWLTAGVHACLQSGRWTTGF